MGPRAGLDGRKISSPPGFDPGPSSPVAQSLYRLSYRAHFLYRCRMELQESEGNFVMSSGIFLCNEFWNFPMYSAC